MRTKLGDDVSEWGSDDAFTPENRHKVNYHFPQSGQKDNKLLVITVVPSLLFILLDFHIAIAFSILGFRIIQL